MDKIKEGFDEDEFGTREEDHYYKMEYWKLMIIKAYLVHFIERWQKAL